MAEPVLIYKEENRRAVYQQLCSSYVAIDSFRAHLLGLLPIASGAGIFLLLKAGIEEEFLQAVGWFGIVITLGLYAYELYGIKKCHCLIQYGIQMEKDMKIVGQFRTGAFDDSYTP